MHSRNRACANSLTSLISNIKNDLFSFSNLRKFGITLVTIMLIVSSITAVSANPSQYTNATSFTSFLGISEYIMSFFRDDSLASEGRLRRPASPGIEDVDSDRTSAKTITIDGEGIAPACVASGNPAIQVPSNAFSIQDAINNAFNGDTIHLGSDTFVQQFRVDKCLFIEGEGETLTKIQAPPTLNNGIFNARAIVEVFGNYTGSISNLTVQGRVDTTGNPVFGVFASAGANIIMSNVTVKDIRDVDDTKFGLQNGRAVVAGWQQGFNTTGSLDLNHVTVESYQKSGIYVSRFGSSASIKNSTITGEGGQTYTAQNGITVLFGATATIEGNTISNNLCNAGSCGPSGVWSYAILAYSSGDITVTNNNQLLNNDGGIYSWTPGESAIITGNTIENARYSGIDIDEGSATINSNWINGNASGPRNGIVVGSYIGATETSSATILQNSITNPTLSGILLYDEDTADGIIPTAVVHFNRISGNATGLNNTLSSSNIDATNNFWGCNDGPNNIGCDTTTGAVTVSPWLQLTHTVASASPINTGQTSDISGTSLRWNSANQDTYNSLPGNPHVIDGLTVNYSVTNGTINNPSSTFTNGLANGTPITTFTAGGPFQTETTGVVTAKIDNAEDTASITINDQSTPTVTVNQASGQVDPTTNPSIAFTVQFNEDVQDFTAVSTAGSTPGSVGSVSITPVSGSTYSVTVTAAAPGLIKVSVPAGAAHDSSGNLSEASTSTDNEVGYFSGTIELMVDDAGVNCLSNGAPVYTTIQSAVGAANPGNIIRVCSGSYNVTANTQINTSGIQIVNAEATKPTINVSGTNLIFTVLVDGVKINGMNFVKTDTAAQNVIQVQGTNFTAQNNDFTATTSWQSSGTARAFEISATATGLLIDGNTITDFRQPAYINGGAAALGTISNNTVTGTKGWVVDGAMVTFTGNTMENCAACDTDIALLDSSTSGYQAFYADRIALSNSNNNAHIDVQFTVGVDDSGRANTYVATTGSASNNGRTATSAFASIQQAVFDPAGGIVDGTLPGGTVHVAAGTYSPGAGLPVNARVLVNRSINLVGTDGAAATIVDGTNTAMPDPGLFRIETLAADNGNTNVSGFTFKNVGAGSTTRTAVFAKPLSPNSTVTVFDNRFIGVAATSAPFDQAFYAYHPRGPVVFKNNYVTNVGGNPVLLELAEGGSDVHDNVFANNFSGYFNMTYAISGTPINISALQRVASNTFYGPTSSSIAFSSAFGSAGNFSNVAITDNIIQQLGASKTAITLNNGSSDGTSGEILNAVITGNSILGTKGSGSRGIRLAGLVSNVNVSCNTIVSTTYGVRVDAVSGNEPSGAIITNSFAQNEFGVQNNGTATLNATNNFWGAADGPGPVGPGSGDKVSSNVDFSGFTAAAAGCAPAVPATHVPATTPNSWFYYDDIANSALTTPNDYAYGLGTPVLGIGSARLLTPASGNTSKLLFATKEFNGTRLDDINHFSYFTYVTSGSAPFVQLGIDADLTDSNTNWQGRLVWVPSNNGPVVNNTWQYWYPMEGEYWATQAPVNSVCPQSNPCTLAEIIAAFPNIGIGSDPSIGFIGFRADPSWNTRVDAVSVGTNTGFKTFDFEPTVPTLVSITHTPADPTNQPITFTVTFNEPVIGFDSTDTVFSGINGTPSISGSGSVYTVTFTPDAAQNGTLTLNIPAGAAVGDPSGSPTSNSGSDSVVFDNINPIATIMPTTGQPDPTNGTISFTASFSETVSGFDSSDVVVTNGSVTTFHDNGDGTYTIIVTAAGTGAVTATIPANVVADAAGNLNLASGTATVNYDGTIPSVTINHAGPTSSSSPVSFTVTFSEPVSDFDDASDIVVTGSTTGGILSADIVDSGDHLNYTVTVSGMANSGDVVISVPAGAAIDTALNGNSPSTPLTAGSDTIDFTVDSTTIPVTPSSAPGLNWSYYNDSTNSFIGAYDFVYGPGSPSLPVGSAGLRTATLVPGSPTDLLTFGTNQFNNKKLADITELSYETYVVSGSGGDVPTLQFNVDFDLTDSNTSYQGRVVWVPTQNGGTLTPDTWQPWNVITSNSVFWYSNEVPEPTRSECTQGIPCTLSDMLADHPNMGIHNTLGALLFRVQGNSNAAVDKLVVGVDSNDTVFDFEPSVPSLTSITHSPAGPTNAASIDFTVTFSEPVNGFDAGDTVFSGITGTPSISGSGSVYTVTFTPSGNQTGTLTLNITAGSANGDPSGVPTANAGSDSVVYDNAAPTVTIDRAVGQNDSTSTSPINFAVTFSEPVSGFDASDVTLNPGTTGASNLVVTGSGDAYNVAISGMNASGTVSISVATGAAIDGVGNLSLTPNVIDDDVMFALSNSNVVVNPINLNGWNKLDSDPSVASGFETGPGSVPLGTGSFAFRIPADGDQYAIMRNNDYAGTPLADLTELSYSTYAVQNNGAQTPYLSIKIDYDNDNIEDDRLYFEPVYQSGGYSIVPGDGGTVPNQCGVNSNCVTTGTWQTWNALVGGWWSNNDNTGGPPLRTLGGYIAAHPGATILNDSLGGVRLIAGGGSGAWDNFVGNVDRFVIGVNSSNTTFDFEAQPPTLSINDVSVAENGGTAAFTISLSQPSLLPTTVLVSTSDGTATVADNDYVSQTNSVVTIPAGSTTASFAVTINDDAVYESNETFTVTLSNALNAAILDGSGTGTITNDEPIPTISIANSATGAEPSTPNSFNVTLSGQSDTNVTVNFATSDGTASASSDYVANSGTITFLANTTTLTQSISVATLDDMTPEPTENFTVSLSGVSGANIGTGSANGIIADSGLYVSISGNIQQYNSPGPNTNLGGVTVTLGSNVTVNGPTVTTTDGSGNFVFNVGLLKGAGYQVSPSGLGKIYDPIYRNYSNVTADIANSNFIAYNNLTDVPRKVSTGLSTVTPGNQVVVPVLLNSLGNENAVSFSMSFDSSILTFVGATVGADDPAGNVLTNTSTPGSVGMIVANPTGQTFGSAGNKEVALLTFSTVTTSAYSTPLTFTNVPTIRKVGDISANPLQAQFTNGLVIFSQGIEGDVNDDVPPTSLNGDGDVDLGDFIDIGNMAVGNSVADFSLSNQFQRADVEPTVSKGNGQVDLGDFIQAGNYAFGIDPIQTVGGPAYPIPFPLAKTSVSSAIPRVAQVVSTNALRGDSVFIDITLDSEVGDKGLSFTLDYDPAVLENPVVSTGPGAPGAFLIPNTGTAGKVGVGLAYITGAFVPGNNVKVRIQFSVKGNAPYGISPLTFSNSPALMQVRDSNNVLVATNFSDGSITILPTTAANGAINGQVLSAEGRPISNVQVMVSDDQGQRFRARSNNFGFFRVEDLPAGRTYILSGRAKGYSFPAQSVTLNQSVVTINLIADQ